MTQIGMPVVGNFRLRNLLAGAVSVQHSVDANKSNEERVSVSFNLMFFSFTERLSKPLW